MIVLLVIITSHLFDHGCTLTMLTGGKSHLEIQREGNTSLANSSFEAAPITDTKEKLQFTIISAGNSSNGLSQKFDFTIITGGNTTSTTKGVNQKLHFQHTERTSTSTTKKSRQKNGADRFVNPAALRHLRRPGIDFNIPPEKINKFPAPLARLMASLNDPIFSETGAQSHHTNTRKKRQIDNSSISVVPETRLVCPLEPPCDLAPFQAFLPHEEMVLAFKNGKVHMLSPNGEILIPRPVPTDILFPDVAPNITAALKIKNQIYLFFGTTYMKYRPIRRPPVYPRPVPVPTGFHGVPVPVDAAFQLNAHTYVFVSGPSFVFYQPDANPPVNSAFSPNVLSNIFGGPSLIDTAFNTPDGRRFLVSEKTLYEINDKMQVIKTLPFRKGLDKTGWLDCSAGIPAGCNAEGLPVPVSDAFQENHLPNASETWKEPRPHQPEHKPARLPNPQTASLSPTTTSDSQSQPDDLAASTLSTLMTSELTRRTVTFGNPLTTALVSELTTSTAVPSTPPSTHRSTSPTTLMTFTSPAISESPATSTGEPETVNTGQNDQLPTQGAVLERLEKHEAVLQQLVDKLNELARALSVLPLQIHQAQSGLPVATDRIQRL